MSIIQLKLNVLNYTPAENLISRKKMTDRPISISVGATIEEIGHQIIARTVLAKDNHLIGKNPLGVLTVKVKHIIHFIKIQR